MTRSNGYKKIENIHQPVLTGSCPEILFRKGLYYITDKAQERSKNNMDWYFILWKTLNWQCQSVSCLGHHFGPDYNILTNMGWIAREYRTSMVISWHFLYFHHQIKFPICPILPVCLWPSTCKTNDIPSAPAVLWAVLITKPLLVTMVKMIPAKFFVSMLACWCWHIARRYALVQSHRAGGVAEHTAPSFIWMRPVGWLSGKEFDTGFDIHCFARLLATAVLCAVHASARFW